MRWGRQVRGHVPEYWGDLLLMLSRGEKCLAEPAVKSKFDSQCSRCQPQLTPVIPRSHWLRVIPLVHHSQPLQRLAA
jgi:hypothetical protein